MSRARSRVAPEWLPRDFSGAGAVIGDAGEREEQIGQTIQVDHDDFGNFCFAGELHDAAFRATTDGARHMQRGGFRRAAGNDERFERLELRIAVVDRALELRDATVVDAWLV